MSVYLIATLKVDGKGMGRFRTVMKTVQQTAEGAGWRLRNAFIQRTGRLNTVIDVWELRDFNHMDEGMRAIAGRPDFADIQKVLQETILEETLTLCDPLDYQA